MYKDCIRFGSLLVSLLPPGYYGDTFGPLCVSVLFQFSIISFQRQTNLHNVLFLKKDHWTLWNSWKHSFELALYIYVCISTERHVLCHQQCWFHHYSLHINHITLTSITLFYCIWNQKFLSKSHHLSVA